VIFVTENSNKSQKTKFWKERLVKDMVALQGLPFNSRMMNWYVPLVLLEKS
jgi:hypothetical protein